MGKLTRAFAASFIVICAACSSSPQQGGPGSSGAPTSSAPNAPASAAPGSRAAIRDNTARGAFTDGIALEARALVSKVTKDDGLSLAIRFVRETKPSGRDPWDSETVDGSAVLASLHFDVEMPGGAKRSLDVAPDPAMKPSPSSLNWYAPTMTLERTGLTMGPTKHAWKAPVDDLVGVPGTNTVTVTATFKAADRTLVLASGKLAFEVVAPSGAHKSLVDLERAASEVARSTWSTPSIPIPRDPTVDDVEGNVSVRFERPDAGGRSSYDDRLLEVWLDRSGKLLVADDYLHFTCVAEGTPIATPRGPVAIEALAIGAEVLAFDVETKARTVATVVRKDRDRSSALVRFGDLLVTREHPIWAGGTWRFASDVAAGTPLLGTRLEALAAQPVAIAEQRVVYDLGVTAPHTYFAGGVLVHNKAAGVPLGGAGRPWGALFFRHAAK